MSFLEVDAAEQYEERRAQRHASLLAAHRSGRFRAFLDQSADDSERALRYAAIEGDVRAVVAAVCEECHSPDAEAIYSAVERRLAGGAFCDDCHKWKTGPKGLCECDGDDESVEKESRRASDSTGLSDEASPKIDKSKAGDEKSNKSRKPIDTDGGPYKTRHQDVAEPADYTKDSFLDQTDQVAKHGEDVTKGTETSGEKPSKTVPHGKGKQADPVTSHFLTAAQIKDAIGG